MAVKGSRSGVMKNCLVCSMPFYVIKAREKTAKYCSKDCSNKAQITQFCPNNHDTFVVGRDNDGRCRECGKLRQRKDPTKNSSIRDICPKGHDKRIVGRRKNGTCIECARERTRAFRKEVAEGTKPLRNKKQICKNGHDTFIYGRSDNGSCNKCMEEYQKTHKEQHNIAGSKYSKNNREKVLAGHRKWKKAHPESQRAYKIKADTERALRVVAWTDWKEIKKIYRKRLKNIEVDHYIPLLGDLVAGLHVSWNLQYLTKPENAKKGNKCNLLEASAWYGKILEESGLK